MFRRRRSDQFALFDFYLCSFSIHTSSNDLFAEFFEKRTNSRNEKHWVYPYIHAIFIIFGRVCEFFWRARAALCKNSIRRKTYIYRTLFMVSTMCASPRQRSDFRCRPFCFFRVWFLRFLRKLFLFLFYCLRQLPRQIEHNSSFFRPFSCAVVVVVQREFNSIVFGTSSNLQQTWGSMCAATTAAAIRGEYEFVISYKTMEKLERKKLFTHAHRRHLLHAK